MKWSTVAAVGALILAGWAAVCGFRDTGPGEFHLLDAALVAAVLALVAAVRGD